MHLYLQDLKDLKIETATDTLKKVEVISDESDYFLEQRAATLKSLSDRIDAIGGYKLLEQYQKVADYFNENIANKHSFTDDPSVQDEVDLASLKELFALMGEKSFALDDYIAAFKARETAADRYIDFYKSLDMLRRLFKPFADGKSDTPSASLQIYFHASKQRESKEADYLTDQEFDFGTGTPFDISDNGKKVVWSYGEPVNVIFKLADTAPVSMFTYSEDETSFTKVSETEGMFSYEGLWALFKLLAEKGDKKEKGLLQFDVPVSGDRGTRNLRTFIKITLQSTDEKDPATVGEFPKLPQKAPTLSKKTRETINSLHKETTLKTEQSDDDDDE